MKRNYLTSLFIASALVVTGCSKGGGNTAAPGANAAAPADGNAAAPAAGGGGEAQAPAAGQAQQNFTVVNNTGHTVMTLNVSPSNADSWGPDILGSQVLANGQSAQVSFPRGESQCQWDVKATYDDGDTTDMRAVNLCEVATVTLIPAG
jgi:hypothetical protein